MKLGVVELIIKNASFIHIIRVMNCWNISIFVAHFYISNDIGSQVHGKSRGMDNIIILQKPYIAEITFH